MEIAKYAPPAPPPEAKLHFLDYWRIIRVRKTVIMAVFLLVVLTTTMVTFYLPESFSSSVRIEVEKDTPDIEGMTRSQVYTGFDPYWMQTQFEIIQSHAILSRVINKLNLAEKFGRHYSTDGAPLRADETLDLLQKLLTLNQFRNTSLIEIKVFSKDRQEAADIANEIALAYREYRLETRRDMSVKGLKSLQEKLDIKLKELQRAQSNVDNLRIELKINNIDPYGGKVIGTLDQETLRRLEAFRVESQADFVQLDKLLKQLKSLDRVELKKSMATASPDQLLTTLLEEQARAEHKRAMLEPDYGTEHPEMQRINNLLEKLDRQINDRLDGILSGVATRVAAMEARAKDLSEQVADARQKDLLASEKMRPFLIAKEELDLIRQVHDALSMKVSSEEVDKGIPTTSMVRIVDPAQPGQKPVRPNKTLNISLGVLVGLMLGIGLAFFVEYLDTSVKTIDDVERALQAPVLGVIPQHVGILYQEGPETPHAEPYRVLRTNLLFSRKDQRGNTITVVSAGAGEGKSTTLFNLATIFAQSGARVLVVDSDLRRPSLHKLVGVSNSLGLTNCLLKQNTLPEVIQTTPMPNLDFLPSGKLPSSSMGILSSSQMKDLIQELKQRYDFVFFDSPPIMGVSDASILASSVDMTLQVIQYRRYPQPMTMRAKQMIEKVGGNLMGIVLNNINMSQDENYYYYSGYYEENQEKPGARAKKAAKLAAKAGPDKTGDPEIKQKY